MDGVEAVQREREGVGLAELERIVRLSYMINAHDLETGPVVAHGSTPSTTE